MHLGKRTRGLLALGLDLARPRTSLVLLAAGAALGAQDPLADQEEQRRRARSDAEGRQRQAQAPQVHLQAPEPLSDEDRSLDLPAEDPSFRLDRLILEVPATAGRGRPFAFAERYLARYAGRSVGPEGLRIILRRLTRRILARGYTTTRLDVPGQDLGGGTLRLTLVPGLIRSIRFADPAPRGTWRTAFPARPGDLFNLRALEQGLEQMKRVPSQDVTIAILPGPLPGESDLVLTVVRGRALRGALTVEDGGHPATGQWQGTLNAAWDNPLGWSDLLGATLGHDLTAYRKGSGTRGAGLTWSVPLGNWTFGASWSQNEYRQRLQGLHRTFTASGLSRNLDVRVGRLLHRDQTGKTALQFRAGHRHARGFFEGLELDVQRRSSSFAELSLTHTQYLGRAQLDLAVVHRQGVSWFGAGPDPGSGGPTSAYRLRTLDATFSAPLSVAGRPVRYTATLHGQHCTDRLHASEFLTLGNRWAVRGFEGEWTLAAEGGAFLRNDLEWPLGSRAALYLGLDVGRVQGPSAWALPGRTLAGAVAGLKFGVLKRLHGHVFLACPVRQPASFQNPWPVAGVSASLQF